MIINSINTESITPVEYNHIHDSTLVFRKYRENFDFGLTVDQRLQQNHLPLQLNLARNISKLTLQRLLIIQVILQLVGYHL